MAHYFPWLPAAPSHLVICPCLTRLCSWLLSLCNWRVEALQFQSPSGWRVYSQHSRAVNQRVLQVLIEASHSLPRSSLLHGDQASLWHVELTDRTSVSSLANQSPVLIKGSMAPLLASAPFHSTASGRIFWFFNLHICEWPFFGRMSSLNYKWKFALQGRRRLGKENSKSRLGTREPLRGS